MSLRIGQRVGNRIYAGKDYGLQSPATFEKLKREGAFKFGAKEIRRLQSSVNKLIPKQVKEAASDFFDYQSRVQEFARQQREKSLLGKAAQASIDIQGLQDRAIGKAVDVVSDKTNIARPIVAGGAALIQGRVEAGSAKLFIPKPKPPKIVPTRQSRGRGKPSSIQRRLQQARGVPKGEQGAIYPNQPGNVPERKLEQPTPKLPEGAFPGGSRASLKRDTEVRKGIQQRAKDIREGKATPSPDSVRKASDAEAMAKAEAAAKSSKGSNKVTESEILPTVRGDSTDFYVRKKDGTITLKSKTESGNKPATPLAEPIRGKAANTKRIKHRLKELKAQQKARFEKAKDKIQQAKDLERSKAEQKNVDRFFSGEGTHPTFPSKKGADVRSKNFRVQPDDVDDYLPDLDGLYDSNDGMIAPGQDGVSVWDGERTGGGRGQPGQAAPLARAIQQKHFRETGTYLSEQAVRDRVKKILFQRRFPEQFNQIEARERGGVELPARNRNTADRKGRKTRQHGSRSNPGSRNNKGQEVVNPDRDYVLGKGSKPREANKIPNADKLSVRERIRQRTQTNETNRIDNIPGGRRIKQSKVESKKRIQEARARARARRMSSMIGKRRVQDVVKADKKARAAARKEGVKHQTKLPETKPGVAEQQFHDYPKGKMTAKQRKGWKQEEKNRQAKRILKERIKSRERLRRGDDRLPDSNDGNRGRNRTTSLEDFRLEQQSARSDKTGTYSESAEAPKPRIGNVAQPVAPKRGEKSIARRASQRARSNYEKELARLKVTDPEAYEEELRRFLREHLKTERFISPQDGLKNPNPFTSSGEVRDVQVVRGKNPTIGEGELRTKVKSYGDPASEGRSKKQRNRGEALKQRAKERKKSGGSWRRSRD